MIWLTEIKKADPLTGEIKTWCGPRIEADTRKEAIKKIKAKNCKIIGILLTEIDYADIETLWVN